MRVKPNRTRVEAQVENIRPNEGGLVVDIELKVIRNDSEPASDFLRPAEGAFLTAFASERPAVKVGDVVKVDAMLLAGPRGQRMVVQALEPVTASLASSRPRRRA
jgi:hypothetical protein